MVFCNLIAACIIYLQRLVTILILVDGFLQYAEMDELNIDGISHNPYFSRWFSAIRNLRNSSVTILSVTILILVDGFLQCV